MYLACQMDIIELWGKYIVFKTRHFKEEPRTGCRIN